MLLRHRHVLLTGATGTIGRRLAEQLVERGARVTLVARSVEPLEDLARRVGGHPAPADLTDPGAPAALLTAPLALTRLLLPGMLARGSGHVVMVSSLAGVATFPGLGVYGATKAGLTHAAAALRIELDGTGVGTTVAELGPVVSTMMDRARRHPDSGASFARAEQLRGLRELDPGEVARAVVEAVEAGRPVVRLPRRAAPLAAMSALPRDLVRLVVGGSARRRRVERSDGAAVGGTTR
jgi:short-subunit dehydrogenase